jgi:hypothetical protein
MKLTESARLEGHIGGGDGLGDGEVGRVNLPELTTRTTNCLWRVLQRAVDKRRVLGRVWQVHDVSVGHSTVGNVRVGLGQVVKHRLVDVEVLGEDVLRRVGQPVINVEGRAKNLGQPGLPRHKAMGIDSPSFLKVAVIKYEKIFVVVFKTVNGVGNTLGEVPNVAEAELGRLVDTILVNNRDEDFTRIHYAPFSLSRL